MSHADFVHLCVHSAYSLAEGAIKIADLAALCVDAKMPAVGLTDTNNLFGAMEFSTTMAENGVQPIIGCRLDLAAAPENPLAKTLTPATDRITLFCQDKTGYLNLLWLVSKSVILVDENDAAPEGALLVNMDDLKTHGAGLICLTGGATGPVGRRLAEGRAEAAQTVLEGLKATFPDRLYMEIQRHGLEVERRTDGPMIDLAYDHDVPLVATNEVYFAKKSMFEAHDALICIAEGTYVSEETRRRLTPHHRFKSPVEMKALFADLPEAIDNSLVIARRCGWLVEPIAPLLPAFDSGEETSEEEALRRQSKLGLQKRLQALADINGLDGAAREQAAIPYLERLDYELDVIVQMGFSGYYLIVADFIKWAKAQGIPVGPGRGSGAGSVTAWALTITDLDPLRFGLLFERFLNPERVSMPDFDVDFCQERRDEVIHYVQEKYGKDKVAQIITFGKLQPRAVIRDTGRVLQMSYSQVDRICKLIPTNAKEIDSLDKAIAAVPALRAMIDQDPKIGKLVDLARPLEGLYRHASTHAAGVVIGDRPLHQLVPLYRDPRSEIPATQFSMNYVESAGLVKFDFLGLKTLTVLSTTLALLKNNGLQIDLSQIPLDDPVTFAMLGEAETHGIFQLESAGMRAILKQLKPGCIDDIMAVVALHRPGPMENIPSYIRRRHRQEEPDYLYPTLKPILEETYGILVYQEQVMQVAQELAGFSLGSADLLRRAMGKKQDAAMIGQRQAFVDGAVARGVEKSKANEIFDLMAKFADYGFVKSHAASYALVAYQTAYLKANHPTEFFAASMSLDINQTDKLNGFRQELARLKIDLRTPDVNASDATFTVERDEDGRTAIRYGLAAIKNVGAEAMRRIVAERRANGPFADIFDFFDRLDSKAVNKRQVESLIVAGAFDGMDSNRRKLFEGLEVLMMAAAAATEARASDQIVMFGGDGMDAPKPKLEDIEDWSSVERLGHEFEAIGFYLSAHPLEEYEEWQGLLGVRSYAEIIQSKTAGPVTLMGTVIECKERLSVKNRRPYAFLSLTDSSGTFEVIVFSEVLSQARNLLQAGKALLIEASAQFEDGILRLSANVVSNLQDAIERKKIGLRLVVDSEAPLMAAKQLLEEGLRGNGEVILVCRLDGGVEVEVCLGPRYEVTPDMVQQMRSVPGVLSAGGF